MVISHILLALMLTAAPFASSMTTFDDVVMLTPNNFDKEVGQDRGALVRFFNPWYNCEDVEYEKAGAIFKKTKNVLLGKVDCDEHGDLCGKYGITDYPTFLWFPKWSLDAKRYQGPRTTEAFVEFINTEAGTMVKLRNNGSYLVVLSPETFDRIVLDETKDVLVIFEFYSPWSDYLCGYEMIYEKLASVYKLDENVVVAIFDAYKYKGVAQKYNPNIYPTCIFFPKGNKDGQVYKGYLDVDDLVKFINEKSGTRRNTKGQLNSEAGKVEILDEFVKEFTVASIDQRDEILTRIEEEVAKLTGPTARFGKVYVKVSKNVLINGANYAKKEIDRLLRMLEKILLCSFAKSHLLSFLVPSIGPSKQDEFVILKKFFPHFLTIH